MQVGKRQLPKQVHQWISRSFLPDLVTRKKRQYQHLTSWISFQLQAPILNHHYPQMLLITSTVYHRNSRIILPLRIQTLHLMPLRQNIGKPRNASHLRKKLWNTWKTAAEVTKLKQQRQQQPLPPPLPLQHQVEICVEVIRRVLWIPLKMDHAVIYPLAIPAANDKASLLISSYIEGIKNVYILMEKRNCNISNICFNLLEIKRTHVIGWLQWMIAYTISGKRKHWKNWTLFNYCHKF